MINLHESMGPGRDRTHEPWICGQTRICCQTRYRLRYVPRSYACMNSSCSPMQYIPKSHVKTMGCVGLQILIPLFVGCTRMHAQLLKNSFPDKSIIWLAKFSNFE